MSGRWAAVGELLLWALLLEVSPRWLDLVPLSANGGIGFRVIIGGYFHLTALFCLFLGTALALMPYAPRAARHWLLLAVGAPLFWMLMDPRITALCLVLALLVHGSDGYWTRLLLVASMPLALWWCAESLLLAPGLGRVVQMRLIGQFYDRLLYWCYERKRITNAPLGECFFYFFGLPFLTFDPVVPSFLYLRRRQADEPPPALFANGMATLRRRALALLALAAVLRWGLHHNLLVGPLFADHMMHTAHGGWLLGFVVANFVFLYWRHEVGKGMSVACLRLLGYDVHDAFHYPLLSNSPADFFRRWNIYWREFLVMLFFNPVVLAISRRWPQRRDAATFIACLVIFAASALLDFLPFLPPLTLWAYTGELAIGVLVGLSLVLELHRVRFPRLVKWALGVPFTLISISLLWQIAYLGLDWRSLLDLGHRILH